MEKRNNKITIFIIFCGLISLYLLLVGQFSKSELFFGCFFSFCIAILFIFSKSVGGIALKFDKKMFIPFVYVPMAVIKETALIFFAEFQKLSGKKVSGRIIETPYEYRSDEPESSTKFALAIFGINVSPNSYVSFYENGRVKLRQLIGDKLSKGDAAFLKQK